MPDSDVKAPPVPLVLPASSTAQVTAPVPASTEKKVTLADFCRDLSLSDQRVELIGGFHHSEQNAKNLIDYPSAYMARYIQFGNLPV